MNDTISLFISSLKCDLGTQARVKIDQSAIEQYAEHIKGGGLLPPIKCVFTKDGDYIPYDGHHSIAAHKLAGIERIDSRVVEGDLSKAKLLCIGANLDHGVRRTHEDRQQAIFMAIDHPNFRKSTEEEIAEFCGTSRREVFRARKSLDRVKNPGRKRDPEYEEAIKIIRADNPNMADDISVGIRPMAKADIIKLASKTDDERIALVGSLLADGGTLEDAEQRIKYRPKDENLPVSTYLDYAERNPDHTSFIFRKSSVQMDLTQLD